MARVSETVTLPHDQLALTDRTALVLMLVHAFHHIVCVFIHIITLLTTAQEIETVRKAVLPLVSIGIWNNIPSTRRERECAVNPHLNKIWARYTKKASSLDATQRVSFGR